MKLLKDINGKLSSKRFAGWLILATGLFMAIFTLWKPEANETLILGLIGLAVAQFTATVFEKVKLGDIPPIEKEEK